MNLYQETKFLMDKYNIKANKNLGQNFLIDENVIETAIEKSEINKEDLVIEIGPGLGTLTKYLLEKAGKVICVELDKRMVNILKERFFLYDNFEIINDDILRKNEVIMIEGIQEKIPNKDDFITVTTIINKPNAIVIKKSNGNILFIVFVSPSVLTININNVIKNKT